MVFRHIFAKTERVEFWQLHKRISALGNITIKAYYNYLGFTAISEGTHENAELPKLAKQLDV